MFNLRCRTLPGPCEPCTSCHTRTRVARHEICVRRGCEGRCIANECVWPLPEEGGDHGWAGGIHMVHHLPAVPALALAQPLEGPRAVGANARPGWLQRQIPDEPVLVHVREHGAAVVQLHSVGRDPTRHALLLFHHVVHFFHGPGRPIGEVVGGILDGAGDAVVDAEAPHSLRALAHGLW
eukprot:4538769-Prymnesium_polylepis.1